MPKLLLLLFISLNSHCFISCSLNSHSQPNCKPHLLLSPLSIMTDQHADQHQLLDEQEPPRVKPNTIIEVGWRETPCEICGLSGGSNWECLLVYCRNCRISAVHHYCMWPHMWSCEECPGMPVKPVVTDAASGSLPGASLRFENMTNEDELGRPVTTAEQEQLQEQIRGLLGLDGLPTPDIITLNRFNIKLFKFRTYYAAWNAVGKRYFLFITSEGSFLVDENFSFRKVSMLFHMAKGTGTNITTLLDGEMVIDTDPTTGDLFRRFLVSDALIMEGQLLLEKPFEERQLKIKNKIPLLRESARRSQCPFRVREHRYAELVRLSTMLDLLPGLPHTTDGMLFKGFYEPYPSPVYRWRSDDGLLSAEELNDITTKMAGLELHG